MATARAMILRSLRMIGEKQPGGTLTAAEATDHFNDLNTMLESWRTDPLLVYQILEESFTLVVGFNAYTIGSGGNFNTTNPTKVVDTCLIYYQNVSYPVTVVNEKSFSFIQTGGLSGRPENLYFDKSEPLSTIYFDRLPDIAYDFRLKTWKQLQSFATIDTDVVFPPGYRLAIESNYAIHAAAGLATVSQEVDKIARESKAVIKNLNAPEGILRLERGIARRTRYDIRTGW